MPDADHDAHTGLLNMRAFRERVPAELSSSGRVGVIHLDVQDLRMINAWYGNSGGDVILRALAVRLTNALHAEDLVARLGGDEFIVIANVDGDADELALLTREVEDAISSKLFSVHDQEVHVGVTVRAGMIEHPEDLARLFREWF